MQGALACRQNGIVFDNTMHSRIVAVVLGLVAEIERHFISSRTKEALAKSKTPMRAMKDCYASHPHLFLKWPYDHPGCDR